MIILQSMQDAQQRSSAHKCSSACQIVCSVKACLYQVAQVVNKWKTPRIFCSDFVLACELQTVLEEVVELSSFKATQSFP